ncbi:hypothetical protein BN1708_018860, partial [Verticillium longisporum]
GQHHGSRQHCGRQILGQARCQAQPPDQQLPFCYPRPVRPPNPDDGLDIRLIPRGRQPDPQWRAIRYHGRPHPSLLPRAARPPRCPRGQRQLPAQARRPAPSRRLREQLPHSRGPRLFRCWLCRPRPRHCRPLPAPRYPGPALARRPPGLRLGLPQSLRRLR